MGIEAIKSTAAFVFLVIDKFEDALDDNKITIVEAISLLPGIVVKVPGLLEAIPALGPEFADLDNDEIQELVQYFKDNFDLDNDNVEQIVELILDYIAYTYNSVIRVKELTA